MNSSSSPREAIQISLGPTANTITAHLLNLQGLAATTSSYSDDVYCDPNTTHCVQSSGHRGGGTLVPRVLFVDEATNQVPGTLTTEQGASPYPSIHQAYPHTSNPSSHGFNTNSLGSSFWSGNLEVLVDDPQTAIGGLENGRRDTVDASHSTSPFWRTASAMAYSPYSRYHHMQESHRPGLQYRADPDNSRHVAWNDDEEEVEDLTERTYHEEQLKMRWRTKTSLDLGQELDRQVAETFQNISVESPAGESSATHGFGFNHWTDIWMPPRNEKSKIVLPFSSQSHLVPYWDVSYQNIGHSSNTTPFLQEWKEDTLFENVRHMLEACDYGIQGVSIITEGYGIYASTTSYLLEELKQECKSAGRLVYHLRTSNKSATTKVTGSAPRTIGDPLSWQEAKVNQIRKDISSGLTLFDFTENAHAILPLHLPGDAHVTNNEYSPTLSFFRGTAQIAMALEATTLPFRFNGKDNARAGCDPLYRMGLQNAPFLAQGSSDTSWGSTASRLKFSEYLQVLQPSSSYSMLELDVLSHSRNTNDTITNEKLFEIVQEGTSVERDQRTREIRGYNYRTRPREVSPGDWLRNTCPNSAGTKGILSSLSYCTSMKDATINLDRSSHHHFALSTSVRSILSSPTDSSNRNSISNYLTCLVQGMGIQYRPERSMATVLNQSLGQMTFGADGGGGNYGAGIYWKYVIPQVDTPTLAVLGNSTRAYASLKEIAIDMEVSMKTPRYRSYYNRDVSNGVLPELEDCEEALEACRNKRDLYQAPPGSGLDSEDDY